MHAPPSQHSTPDLALISPLLLTQGQWLLQQQPRQALPDFEQMRDTFVSNTNQVRQALGHALAMIWPAIPFMQTDINPAGQQQPAYPVYWVCDPIDGAVQYLNGLPLWTITLCLVTAGEATLALVHQPATGLLYRAVAGKGADCNGEPLSHGQRHELSLAMLGTSFPNYPQRPQQEVVDFTRRLTRVIPKVFAQRWMGPASLSLSQLAAGQLDGYWEQGGSLYDWLPGALIAKEAGVVLTALDGKAFDWGCEGILAAPPALHQELADILM